jgi:hypothetical protein
LPSAKRPLIGVDIRGGLGNQLFQFAAGYCLARRNNAELRLNTYRYPGYFRELGLSKFDIQWKECRNPEGRGALRAIGRALGLQLLNPFRGVVFEEPSTTEFWPKFLEIKAPSYVIGLFESWRYCDERRDELRRVLDTSRFASERTAPLEQAIREATRPVSVHVRRGDKAQNPGKRAKYGVLERDYYDAARAIIERTGPADYFVFSDDIEDAKSMFAGWENLTFISGLTDLEDLMLMTRCQSFIIANSSFSWWGAWLGQVESSVVVAPVGTGEAKLSRDLFPPDWNSIPANQRAAERILAQRLAAQGLAG